MTGGSESNISHIGHLGGVLVGWLYLRRSGVTDGLGDSSAAGFSARSSNVVSSNVLKRRWRRWRMRKKLRAVHFEEAERRRKNKGSNDAT